MASFGDTGIGGSARLPLPDKFDGKMENWKDWSWQVKAYVSLFKVEALRVLEDAELASSPITDSALERLEADTTELVDTELVKFSRQLHYLLTQITSESARLVVRGNTELNGFESWRLLARRFSLPGTALDISLLTRVLEFKFRPDHFEQDYSEWETLKARYERQSGSALPDSILVATLLSKTTGALQQHLRLNVRSLDTYETVRNVITAYYQSRHVTGFRILSDTGPAPMDVGAMWQRKGKGRGKWSPLGKGVKGKGKGKGKGRLPSFGQLKGKSKGKGKWFPTGKGKSGGKTHTGKGKDRVRCWKCGQHGHFEKDCKNVAAVTEESEELYDENDWTNDGTDYYVEDWMDWTGALTDDWSYGFDHDWTQSDWYDDSDWCDYGWYDNWTWSSGSDSVGPSALSQPQQPAASSSTAASSTSFTGVQSGQTAPPPPNVSALHSTVNVTFLETGETLTHSPSRRTGTV